MVTHSAEETCQQKKSKGGSVEFKKGAQAIQEGLHKKRGQEPAPNDEGCT